MMTAVDELSKSRFMEMQMTEFYEAICRVADKIPRENLIDFYPIHKASSPWHVDKKIESLIIAICRNSVPFKLAQELEKKYAEIIELAYGGVKLMKVQVTDARY